MIRTKRAYPLHVFIPRRKGTYCVALIAKDSNEARAEVIDVPTRIGGDTNALAARNFQFDLALTRLVRKICATARYGCAWMRSRRA
jgi:hypothetical protein